MAIRPRGLTLDDFLKLPEQEPELDASPIVTLFGRGSPPLLLQGTDRVDLGDIVPGFAPTVDEVFGALRFA